MTSKAHDVTLPQPDEVFRCLLREDVYNQAQASNIDRVCLDALVERSAVVIMCPVSEPMTRNVLLSLDVPSQILLRRIPRTKL